MAYAVSFIIPDSWETYEKIIGELGDNLPPGGLIAHTATPEGDRVRVIDVWESREAQQAFGANLLGPARERAGAATGGPIDLVEADVRHLVR